MAILFGDGVEPSSVGRGQVKRWLHCRIADPTILTEAQQAELAQWLETREVTSGLPLQITRDDAGAHRLYTAGTELEVELAELPVWLQRPDPQPVASQPPAVKPRTRRRSSAAA